METQTQKNTGDCLRWENGASQKKNSKLSLKSSKSALDGHVNVWLGKAMQMLMTGTRSTGKTWKSLDRWEEICDRCDSVYGGLNLCIGLYLYTLYHIIYMYIYICVCVAIYTALTRCNKKRVYRIRIHTTVGFTFQFRSVSYTHRWLQNPCGTWTFDLIKVYI